MKVAAERTEAENLFETLASKSPVGLCIVQDGKFCYTNPTFQSTTGYKEDELLGKDALGLVVPEDKERVRENAIKMLKGERTLPYQFRVTHKNGSIKWIMESVASVQYRGRRATLGDFIDTTAHKQVEEAQREAEEEKSAFLEEAPIGIIHVDLKGKITYVNKRFESDSGYSREEIVGKSGFRPDWFPADTMEYLAKRMVARLRGNPAKRWETQFKCKDGRWIWIELEGKILRKLGVPVGFQIIARNMTERKRAEEALQAEKNKLQSLIDAMEYTLTIQDTEYNIIYQNEPSKIASGGDHLGEKCYRAYEGRETVCDGCPLEEAFKDGKSHTTERRTTIAGKVAFWENTASPIRDAEGRIVACLELARDITKRKEAEQALTDELTRRRLLVDQSLDGIVVLDEDAKVYEANQRFAEMLGYTLEEVHELHTWDWDKIFPPEQILEMGQNVDEKGLHLETKHTRKDGSVIDVDISINGAMCGGQKLIFCVCRDITERKQVDEKVQHLNLVLRAIRNINQLIARGTDRDGLLKGVCDTFVKTRGYYSAWIALLDESGKLVTAAEAGLGKSFLQIMERLKRGELTHCGCKVLEKPGVLVIKDVSSECADCLMAKKGTGRGAMSVRLEYGSKVYGLMTVSIPPGRAVEKEEHDLLEEIAGDIAFALHSMEQEQERKQAEEALQAEKNKLQSVIDAMADDLTIQDRDYNVLFQNEPSRKSTDGDRLGKKCYRAYEGSESICDECPVEKAFKDGKPHASERQRVLPSGEVTFWETTANPIRDAKEEVVSCLEIGRDITERKKQEQALADELTRRRLLVDQSLDGIVVLDVDAKVVEANRSFAEMLGYTLEEVRELHTWDWDKNYSHEQILEMGRNVDEKGLHLETRHTRKDGSVIDVDISINGAMFGGQKLIFCVERDITERKQAEEAINLQRAYFQQLFDNSPDAIIMMDTNDRAIQVNRGFEVLFGYSNEEVKGRSLIELIVPEVDVQEASDSFQRILGREVVRKESVRRRKDGSLVDVSVLAYPIRSNDKLIGAYGVYSDVTERKRAEEALKNSAESYRELADSITEVFFAMDEHLRYTYWNKASEILTGIQAEDAIGKSLRKVFPDTPWIRKAAKVYRNVLRTKQSQTFVNDTDLDGRHYDFEISAYPSRGGISVFIRDITERKKMEEALKLAAEEWRKTFDSISDAISIHDRDFRILRANKAFADIFNVKLRQVIGKHCYELHSGEKPHSGCPHKQTLATGKPAMTEFYESHLGKYLLESTSPVLNEKGEVVGTVHITRDITAQKQQSERLMMADRLASVGELAAGTAHELNNPLTSVLGFSQLVMEKDIPDDIREDLKIIYNEAQRAAGVTKNLLTFARKQAPLKQLTQINTIIEGVLKLRAYEQKANSIEVKRRLDPNIPEIMVDPFQMQQVFLNIIINAEYFMTEAHKKGTLTITAKKQNGSVRISFADDGPGIPEKNLSRIFDPFFTTKEAGKGTGLGLSICHGIVTEHGGHIYARSQLGKGATIIIELPIKKP